LKETAQVLGKRKKPQRKRRAGRGNKALLILLLLEEREEGKKEKVTKGREDGGGIRYRGDEGLVGRKGIRKGVGGEGAWRGQLPRTEGRKRRETEEKRRGSEAGSESGRRNGRRG